MPKLAANLSWLFCEMPLLDRFAAAAQAGFRAVECLFPYEEPALALAARAAEQRLAFVLLNAPAGFEQGERGFGALPGREADFRASLEASLAYAAALDCKRVHVLAGLMPQDESLEACTQAFVENLRYAGERCKRAGVTALIEALNRRDVPGYFLSTSAQAAEIATRVNHPNVRLQLDLYHVQVAEGDLATRVRTLLPLCAHVQIAGNPARTEPDIGEVNYSYLLGLLDELGYDGYVGCEYRPATTTLAGLGWAAAYGVTGAAPPAAARR